MANLVKWWKQFRQYKVIHECSTDSEELIHSSEYGDIVMQQNEKIIHHNFESIDIQTPIETPPSVKGNLMKSKRIIKDQQIKERKRNDFQERLQKRHSIATTHNLEQLEASRSKYNKISCDVSLEDSFEKSQPLNFTFTLYDIEGHGIITKEDISSIVSTIYDSIGNTMIAPLHDKKVINVRLTMSPQDIIKGNEHHPKIRRNLSNAHKYMNHHEPEPVNVVPVLKLKNDINDISKNCGNFEGEKNNLYESINNLKGYKPTIEKILSKGIKTENVDTKNCLDLNITMEKLQSESFRNDQSKNHLKNNVAKKRHVRKQRNQKQKLLEKAARGRSLSVGNEYNKTRQIQNHKPDKPAELNNGSKLRRNELIEIIRESMEKNKLCFQQSNRKTPNIENVGRQRSNTITMMEAPNENDRNNIKHCSFDSYLHNALCGKLDGSNKRRLESMINKPALTLKTSLLNQLNPSLTPEQKLARKLSDIEKWLIERESATKIKVTPDKNVLNQMKCDKLTSEALYETRNKLSPKVSQTDRRCPKLEKDAINSIKNGQNIARYPMNIYVEELEKLRECENLISSTDTDEIDEENPAIYANTNNNEKCENQTEKDKSSAKSSVRFVHIHHHYYHFDGNEKTDKE